MPAIDAVMRGTVSVPVDEFGFKLTDSAALNVPQTARLGTTIFATLDEHVRLKIDILSFYRDLYWSLRAPQWRPTLATGAMGFHRDSPRASPSMRLAVT